MHRNRSTIVFMLAAGALALAATANAGVTKGTFEFSPSVAFNRASVALPNNGPSASITHLNADAHAGYFLNPQWEVGAGLLFQHRGGTARNAFGGSLGATYNFTPQGSVMPYLSAAVGALQYSKDGVTDRSLLTPMIRAGFRTMMWEGRSVNVSFGYQHEANNESPVESSVNLFDIGVGISLFRAPQSAAQNATSQNEAQK